MGNERFIISRLDKVASSLEGRGLLKEAREIDIISNTLEKGSFNFLGFGKRGASQLRDFIRGEVKGKPGYLANKVGIIDHTRGGLSSEGRFRTKRLPKEFKDKFVEGPDGYWYLQDVDSLSVSIYPDKKILYDDSRDYGTEIDGLELVDLSSREGGFGYPLRTRRDYGKNL